MKKLIIGLFLMLSCNQLHAGDAVLSWVNPTGTESCTAGPAYTNPGGTQLWLMVADIPDPSQSVTSYTFSGLKPGTYSYVSTSYDDTGQTSTVSGTATKVITDFVVQTAQVFYPIAQPNDVFMLPIGTIPVGTDCNPNIEVKGKFAVDRSLVTWAGTAQPLLVVAECG